MLELPPIDFRVLNAADGAEVEVTRKRLGLEVAIGKLDGECVGPLAMGDETSPPERSKRSQQRK